MPIKSVPEKEYLEYPQTLCLSCTHLWSPYCINWRLKDCEKAIDAMGASAVKTAVKEDKGEIYKYKIISCPHYKKI